MPGVLQRVEKSHQQPCPIVQMAANYHERTRLVSLIAGRLFLADSPRVFKASLGCGDKSVSFPKANESSIATEVSASQPRCYRASHTESDCRTQHRN